MQSLAGRADLWTTEGRDTVKARQLSEKVCNPMIREAVEEAERILSEKGIFKGLIWSLICNTSVLKEVGFSNPTGI